uniref:Uncharacterized protein n=1 Tax=Strongyloides venezuelensis TaxID=75913 RepID=A0A0K0FNC1_STRVS
MIPDIFYDCNELFCNQFNSITDSLKKTNSYQLVQMDLSNVLLEYNNIFQTTNTNKSTQINNYILPKTKSLTGNNRAPGFKGMANIEFSIEAEMNIDRPLNYFRRKLAY